MRSGDLWRRVAKLEPREVPYMPIFIIRVREGQTEAEALEQARAEGKDVDHRDAHIIFIIRDDGRRSPQGPKADGGLPVAAARHDPFALASDAPSRGWAADTPTDAASSARGWRDPRTRAGALRGSRRGRIPLPCGLDRS